MQYQIMLKAQETLEKSIEIRNVGWKQEEI